MHLIGFSHHYTKIHGQTYGTLVSVRSTKPKGNRPDDIGLHYDTEYAETDICSGISGPSKSYYWDKLIPRNFDKPLLQLVFVGHEHQIPFTTYREFPANYVPFYLDTWTYDINIPYSDLIGKMFAFKFKGEPLPKRLASKITENSIKIFD